ncbi:unnamed protein product [Polarella glacialis]|uniref:Uncharacterized protein n=1 Tax=Polarella glacialis TaxID=89957 RepID=A0A813IRB5_POLGL|nr:unnamed protein product [Polarella glacialis]
MSARLRMPATLCLMLFSSPAALADRHASCEGTEHCRPSSLMLAKSQPHGDQLSLLSLSSDRASSASRGQGSNKLAEDAHAASDAVAAAMWRRATLRISKQTKLSFLDAVTNDKIGASVSISGNGKTALVGAPGPDPSSDAPTIGTAYIFGRAGNWRLQDQLYAPNGVLDDQFGTSTSISRGTALIGATGPLNTSTGAAYIFKLDGNNTWRSTAKLTPSGGDIGGQFGYSVSMDKGRALIGAIGDISTSPGSAYIFDCLGNQGFQQDRLLALDGVSGDQFGFSTAISGDLAIIGAPAPFKNKRGAAYVFKRVGKKWHLQAKLTSGDSGDLKDQFGFSTSMVGNTAVIGAPAPGVSGQHGAVYVFKQYGKAWFQTARLTAPNSSPMDLFGTSVSLSGRTMVIGAPGQSASYVFRRSRFGLRLQGQLASGKFGISARISGNTVIVGAERDSSNGVSDSGAAYVYQLKGHCKMHSR